MLKLHDVFRCEICGNVTVLVNPGLGEKICQEKASNDQEYFECVLHAGQMDCCGKPMKLMTEKETDTGHEKHKPVYEKTKNGVTVKIGSVPHPMEETHHIQWIELVSSDDRSNRKFLKSGSAPEAKFECTGDVSRIRCFCNLHGLWETKI